MKETLIVTEAIELTENFKTERNKLILGLWNQLGDYCDTVGLQSFTDEDINLWHALTGHSAIQDAVKINLPKIKKKNNLLFH